jgi:hypothetical protein
MRDVSMPATEYVLFTNPQKKTKNYRVNYTDLEKSAELEQGWRFYDMTQNPPETFQSWTICYRQASNIQQVEVIYSMPANPYYITGRYRIDCFVPDRHASVLEANFSIIHDMDEQGDPVEDKITINFQAASNEWKSLGEYELNVGDNPLIGTVHQFDNSPQNNGRRKPREISFGPIRWVPLYQTPEPLYVAANDMERCTTIYLDQVQNCWRRNGRLFHRMDTTTLQKNGPLGLSGAGAEVPPARYKWITCPASLKRGSTASKPLFHRAPAPPRPITPSKPVPGHRMKCERPSTKLKIVINGLL